MFRHYLLTAWKVLLRRKFFTFVNLFGIAITLAVLTVVIAMMENFVRPHGAEVNSSNFVLVNDLMLSNEDKSNNWSSRPGFRFLERHVLPLTEPDLIGLINGPSEGTAFVGGRKLTPQVAKTDGNYWKILDFRFLEGRPIGREDVDSGRFVAVINRAMRDEIFDGESPLGQAITVSGQRFEVVGVVDNESEMRAVSYSDIWVPYTTAPSTNYRVEWLGNFIAILYAEDAARIPAIQDEFQKSLESFVHEDPTRYQRAFSSADTMLDRLAREFMDTHYEPDSKAGLFLVVVAGAMVAFMLLPTINLINLNVSRIMERSSEIGVRKAYGASSRTLVWQFLTENVFLSVVGGLIGYLLGLILIALVESSGLMAYADIRVNARVFLGAFVMMAVFGAFSGAYPAWKMSRLNPVDALRGA